MPSSPTSAGPGAPRVLIVKLAAMGDIVMASTLVAALRARWPAAQVTWLTGEQYAPLVRRFEGVDDVRAVDAEALLAGPGLGAVLRQPRAVWRRGRAVAATLRAVGRRPWDLALVAHGDPRYARLLRAGAVRELVRFGEASGTRYMGEDYARMLEQVCDPAQLPPPEPSASGARHALANLRWPEGAPPRRAGTRRVALAPGGARNLLRDNPLRRWPVEHWADLARHLTVAGCELVVVGAAGDRREADVVLAAAPQAQDRVGRQDLSALLREIATADVLVTHDSGPLHLGQLTRTPTVALFGPTRPAQFVAPGADVRIQSAAAGLPCAPCYDGRDYAVCALNLCLTRVQPAAVAASVLAAMP